MEKINEYKLLTRTIVEQINNFLEKNSFKEKIRIEQKFMRATDGSYCIAYERYYIIGNNNQRIYLDTLKDVTIELLGYDILNDIIENY